MQFVAGIDIGGTKCAVILGQYSGRSAAENSGESLDIKDRIAFSTDAALGPEHTTGKIFEAFDQMLQRNGLAPGNIACVGISCGGPLDSRKGIIMSPPNLYLWDNVPIVKLVEERYGIKASLQNDANAGALAEWRFGAGRGCDNVIFLTFGTGMGAGLILAGSLYSGTNDMAGEIGHIRMERFGPAGYGKAGSFEGFCSGAGIAQLGRLMALEKLQAGKKVLYCEDAAQLEGVNAALIADAALKGDETALNVFRTCGQYLGKGLAILIDILNPQVIILGSIYGRSGSLLEEKMLEAVKAEALELSRSVCRITGSGLGEAIGDYAAMAVAADYIAKHGTKLHNKTI